MDIMKYVWCFVIGGIICVIGQILIDKTKLTSARILVLFVTLGVILTGLGLYEPIVKAGGAGATVPLTGFGYSLAKGAIKGVQENGLLRSIHRRYKSNCRRNKRRNPIWIYSSINSKT